MSPSDSASMRRSLIVRWTGPTGARPSTTSAAGSLVSGIATSRAATDDPGRRAVGAPHVEGHHHQVDTLPFEGLEIAQMLDDQDMVGEENTVHGPVESRRAPGDWQVGRRRVDAQHANAAIDQPAGRLVRQVRMLVVGG